MTTEQASAQAYKQDDRNDRVLVYVNGAFFPRDKAVVSVFDSGFALGDGVWEGLRLVKGKLIGLDAHMDRLFEGARMIDLDIGLDRAGVIKAVQDTLDKNGMTDGAHIRLMITRGLKRTPNQDPRFVIGKATIVIVAEYKTPTARGQGERLRAVHLDLPHHRTRPVRPSAELALTAEPDPGPDPGDQGRCRRGADARSARLRGVVQFDQLFIVRGRELWTSTSLYSFKGITQQNVIDAWRTAGGLGQGMRLHPGAGLFGRRGVRDRHPGRLDACDQGRPAA